MSLEPEPLEEPGVQASTTASEFPVPPQQQFFRPTKPETFAEQRARVARQETLLLKPPEGYAPQRNVPAERPTPYSEGPLAENERVDFVLDVDFLARPLFLLAGLLKMGSYNLEKFKMSADFRAHHKVPLPRQEQGVQANCGQLSHSFGVPEQPALHQAHLRQAGQRQMD